MQTLLPLLFAGVVGFSHAFEIDHLLAMNNMVCRRKTVFLAAKDGVFWGLGHTSTILAIGILMILAQVAVSERTFHFFEAGVGLMLLVLGLQRLREIWKLKKNHDHAHQLEMPHDHRLAYGIGLIHGLAGSGTLIILVMTQIKNPWEGIVFLLIFGAGSILGMLLASSVFFLPFSQKLSKNARLQRGLTVFSSLLCIGFGCKVVFENLFF